MAFKLDLSPTYFWPVTATVPIDGKQQPLSFDAQFPRLKASEIKAIEGNQDLLTIDLAKQILVGWKGIQDEQGAEIPFSETMRDTVLDIPGMSLRVVQCWSESLQQADAKN